MVVGVIMDARRAASEGKSTLTVLTNGNLQVATHLSLSTRLLFWATNAPYWLLAAQLLATPPHEVDIAGAMRTIEEAEQQQVLGTLIDKATQHTQGAIDAFAARGYSAIPGVERTRGPR